MGSDRPKIEKGVPIPGRYDRSGRWKSMPWGEMEEGDSFLALLRPGENAERARRAILSCTKRLGFPFRVHTSVSNGELRIWRGADLPKKEG